MTTPAGRLLTQTHYRQQVAIRAMAVRDAQRLWRLWKPGDAVSWRRMVELAYPLIAARHAVSSAAAARYFETLAAVETGRRERAELAAPLPVEKVERNLASTGLAGTYTAKKNGLPMAAAAQVGFTRFAGSVTRMSLTGGRDTIMQSVLRSNNATGYTRVTSGSACSFCRGLSGVKTDADGFPAHDHCTCTAAPTFGA